MNQHYSNTVQSIANELAHFLCMSKGGETRAICIGKAVATQKHEPRVVAYETQMKFR